MKLKTLLLTAFIFLFVFIVSGLQHKVIATASAPDIIVFVREGCQHCKNEESFLKDVQKKEHFDIKYYHLENKNDKPIWISFTEKHRLSKVTPITVIGKTYIIGFDTPQTTGKEIQNLVIKMKKEKVVTSLGYDQYEQSGLSTSVCTTDRNIPCTISPQREFIVKVPFYGELNIEKYPLIIIASVLGFIDGFNPCAMWVLITFLIILLQVGNRKKMALFAGVFILAEAVMYTLILTVWFKTWDFVQLDTIITPVVGVVSIIGGFLFIKEFRKKELVCKVTNREERSKTYHKIKELATEKFTLITFIGILGVAFSVNIIEFACSIGIPQTFTKILEINNLNFIQSSVLILLYIFFYMFDDLVVFGLALYGADKLALTTKYSKWSNLIGGIVMIVLGLILILKPQLLSF
jgi:cytochrome c biogenesis protein CcdA/glutaredoxin